MAAATFTNLYYRRLVGTEKPCYVCYKPTTTVLATINAVDFLYACVAHLPDPGFASQVRTADDGVGAGGSNKAISPEEIAKVKAEWEEAQKKKAERAKDKAKEKENDKDKGEDSKDDENGAKDKDVKKKASVPGAFTPPSASETPKPATPTHEQYTLHRDIFAMRLAEHRKLRQTKQAKDLRPRLPDAPATPLPRSA